MDQLAIDNFCEYLRIDTMQPNPDYSKAVDFLREQARQLQLDFNVYEVVTANPIVTMKWHGKNKNLKSVVLNSHMDVVPVFANQWKYHPFSAHIDENGDIYARGSQDMKCVGSQYLEAIRRIKARLPNYIPERDVYVLFVPDEEVGGVKGMKPFVETEVFDKMNIGICMDEGLASSGDEYSAYYGDRVCWWLKFKITGNTGHGSQFIKETAGKKARYLLNKFMDYRDLEEARMVENNLTLGDVTTVNLTGTTGGVQHNVVPSPFALYFDVRVTPKTDLMAFRKMIEQWTNEAGEGIELDFKQYEPAAYVTATDSSNPWWTCFENVCQSLDLKIVPQIFPAGTDSRFVRKKGISAIGFSPINRTPILLHDHNEFLNTKTFLHGIDFYEKLIPALAAVSES